MENKGTSSTNYVKRALWTPSSQLLTDKHFQTHILPAGVGWGKSYFGPLWLYNRIIWNGDGHDYAVLAPIHKLLKGINLDRILRLFHEIGLKERAGLTVNRSSSEMMIEITKTGYQNRIFFVTANSYENIVGYDLAGYWYDEPGEQDHEEVFDRLSQRLRKRVPVLQALFTGVFQGVLGLKPYFAMASGPKFRDYGIYSIEGEGSFTRWSTDGETLVMFASTHENPELNDRYIQNMRSRYGWNKELWRQQIHGRPESCSVSSLFKFDKAINVKEVEEGQQLWASWDFNVGQTTWTLFTKSKGEYGAIEENGDNDHDTDEACTSFINKNQKYKNREIIILGDSNGWSSDTRSRSCDYEIIKDRLRSAGFRVRILAARSNPSISMSLLSTNRLFTENELTGELPKLFVSPKCSNMIYSLQSTEADGKGGVKKPANDDVTHRSDHLRYFVWHVAPLHRSEIGRMNYAP